MPNFLLSSGTPARAIQAGADPEVCDSLRTAATFRTTLGVVMSRMGRTQGLAIIQDVQPEVVTRTIGVALEVTEILPQHESLIVDLP